MKKKLRRCSYCLSQFVGRAISEPWRLWCDSCQRFQPDQYQRRPAAARAEHAAEEVSGARDEAD